MHDSDEQEVKIEDTPCYSCPNSTNRPCNLDCPELEKYRLSTEIQPDIYYKKRADMDTAVDMVASGDLYKATEKEQRKLAEELDERGIKPELIPGESIAKPIFTEEDPQYDSDDYVNVGIPISLIKVDKMMALFKETRIIKSFEKELAEQILSYMHCAKIAVIARLAGQPNKQNLHIKISRRIEKLGRYMLKDKTLLSQIKRHVKIRVDDVLTPLKFKQYLRDES